MPDILRYQSSSAFCISFTVLLDEKVVHAVWGPFLGSTYDRSLCPVGLDFGAGGQNMRASIEVSSKDGKSLFPL